MIDISDLIERLASLFIFASRHQEERRFRENRVAESHKDKAYDKHAYLQIYPFS